MSAILKNDYFCLVLVRGSIYSPLVKVIPYQNIR